MRTSIATQQSINSTGPLTGFDLYAVNLLAGFDWTLNLRITSLSAGSGSPSITVNLEVSYDSFVTVHNQVSVSALGPVSAADVTNSWRRYQFGELGFGIGFANAQMRLNVIALNGTAVVDVWVDN